ncbi:unnamed protein product [Spodoptera littoralis]|uniref:Cuticular protein n=1 Tax=Spodoptera littoralis TaxID=7109 RepID=A0A9P0N783_SPOLI|nr:unnamed protein product [Spodoptera littoralis]CAH1644059.1 unnamed protein product [Spodoptera littoralis]
MAVYFYLVAAVVAVVSAAPPPPQQRYPQQAGLHQLNPLDYFIEQPVDNYYRPAEQKQVSVNGPHGSPARLESLEPDSEVELVPGVQQPQQPPQQNPVAPNIPGLVPGQRVFIVHMPVPGYSPGSIGGYQPVYIVAAAPQGNARFPGNGFQNTVLVDPSGHGVVNPYAGYNRGLVQPQVLPSPIGYQSRPYDLVYQDPGLVNAAGQPIQADGRGPIHFSQNVGPQGPVNPAAYQGPVAQLAHPGQTPNLRVPSGAPAQLKQGTEEAKEAVDAKSNHRAQPLTRNKA